MAKPADNELGETWPRFFAHWSAAALGHFLRTSVPVISSWSDPTVPVEFPRWWVALIMAAIVSLIASAFNANAPVTPRELMKSLALGFAASSAVILLRAGA